MSYLANIAYENPDGTFDLYSSHNGGEAFYLTPYLREVADGKAERTLDSIDPRKPWDEMGSSPPEGWDMVDSLGSAVNRHPIARGISLEQLPRAIDFVDSEALYVVRDHVSLYLPVWTYPRVLEALREFYNLEIYDVRDANFDQARRGESLLDEETDPIKVLSGSDFAPSSLEEPALRKYVEKTHLSIFQTGSDKLDSGERTPSDGFVLFEHCTKMNTRETDFVLPNSKGRGVFVRVDWDDDIGRPIDLRYVRDYVESSRVDASIRIIRKQDAPEDTDVVQEELQYVARLVKHFSGRVAEFAAPPYDPFVEKFRARYGADSTSDGDLFRVVGVDTEADSYSFRPKASRVTPQKDVDSRSIDTEVVSVTPSDGDEALRNQFANLRQGDVVYAEQEDPDTVTSVELLTRTDLCFVKTDVVPSFVREKFEKNLSPELQKMDSESEARMIRSPLRSYSDDIDGSRWDVGEFVVAAGPWSNEMWEHLRRGVLSEEMYGGFRDSGSEAPSEAIFIDPPEEPFWYGLIFEYPRCGLSREIRQELNIDLGN